MWWSGPDDPNACLLRVTPLTAELWDGPASRAVAAFQFAKPLLTGEKPDLGENRKVTVPLYAKDLPAVEQFPEHGVVKLAAGPMRAVQQAKSGEFTG